MSTQARLTLTPMSPAVLHQSTTLLPKSQLITLTVPFILTYPVDIHINLMLDLSRLTNLNLIYDPRLPPSSRTTLPAR